MTDSVRSFLFAFSAKILTALQFLIFLKMSDKYRGPRNEKTETQPI